jgi:hypothetical protein
MGPPELEKESPESWSEEFGAEGIETLPRRVDRYGKAKKGALDVAQFIGSTLKVKKRSTSGCPSAGLPAVPALLHHRCSEVACGQLLHEAPVVPSVRHQTGR